MAKTNTATIDHAGALRDEFDRLEKLHLKLAADLKAAERSPNARANRDAAIDRGVARHRQNVEKWLDGITGQQDPMEYIERLPPLASTDFIKSFILANPSTGKYLKEFYADRFGNGTTESERTQNVARVRAELRTLHKKIEKLCIDFGFERPDYLLPEVVCGFDESSKTYDVNKVRELQNDLDSIVDQCSRLTAKIRDAHIDLAKLKNAEQEIPTGGFNLPENLQSVRNQINSINTRLAELQNEDKDLLSRRASRSKLLNNVKTFLRENGVDLK